MNISLQRLKGHNDPYSSVVEVEVVPNGVHEMHGRMHPN